MAVDAGVLAHGRRWAKVCALVLALWGHGLAAAQVHDLGCIHQLGLADTGWVVDDVPDPVDILYARDASSNFYYMVRQSGWLETPREGGPGGCAVSL